MKQPFASSARLRGGGHILPSALKATAFRVSPPPRIVIEHWSLVTLREKLVKIGARIVRHGRSLRGVFQLAEVAVPRSLFASILRRIDDLRPKPPPLPA